jgi:DNA-binding CsgD family transcriptional regulator
MLHELQASETHNGESADAGSFAAAAGELARAVGSNEVEPWTTAARVWARQGRRARVAYARFREADALLRSGGGPAAAQEPLTDAYSIAASLGAGRLLEQVEALARRGRVDIGGDAVDHALDARVDGFRLTDREREVLMLVAKGRTNRQIAEALFISAKTASVHVSNILTKLGVTNRGEAAAEARRFGLD